MAKNTDQAFESIRIVGGLISSKVLQDARRYDLPGQSKEHYQIEPGLTFNDDIGRYWRIAQARWQEFQLQCQRQDVSSHTIAQREWLIPLLEKVLGYRLEISEPVMLGEREFPITHSAFNHAVPFVLCGAEYDLDKGDAIFGQVGRKRSPMGLLQEYLNAESTALWAIVSNGLVLRLLRDNPAMTRPAYIEVDFARMFEEDNYADFATLWLTLHATRLEPHNKQPEQCWLEQWREKGQEDGERILEGLDKPVKEALSQLGTGFLAHEKNQALRDKISKNQLTKEEYFQQILRLVYRFLFLITAEDRDVALLPEEFEGNDYSAERTLYQKGYSLSVLRERARQKRHYDNYGDAWQQLIVTFRGFAEGQPKLAQPALGGLFANSQCSDLVECELKNRDLLRALFNLSFFELKGVLERINYRDMDSEEYGSVYESLLELMPQINTDGIWNLSFIGDAENEIDGKKEKNASGNDRKGSGSYYTPDSLVQELIKSALEPVIEDRLRANPQDPRKALLSIKVCDPACGSGHFLLAAARRLAAELARIDAGSDQPTEDHIQHAMHDVVRNCIYGVDINPLAIELCKTGLWLESIEPGKPMSFLDEHIQSGNSVLGIVSLEQISKGIPTEAYKALSGDDRQLCKNLAKVNSDYLKSFKNQIESPILSLALENSNTLTELQQIENLPEDTVDQIEKKKKAFKHFRDHLHRSRLKQAIDLYMGAYLAPKDGSIPPTEIPDSQNLYLALYTNQKPEELSEICQLEKIKRSQDLCEKHNVFNWPLSFAQVFGGESKGFDCILGNPPWDVSQFNEEEYFSSIYPSISKLKGVKRKTAIGELIESNKSEKKNYFLKKREFELSNIFYNYSGRFPLSCSGKINLYALFVETNVNIVGRKGICGVVVPSGLSTDKSTSALFSFLLRSKLIKQCFELENEGFFKGAGKGHMVRFSLVTIAGGENKPNFIFKAKTISDLYHCERMISFEYSDLEIVNPNTKTLPVLESIFDATLAKKIYNKFGVLINKPKKINPWNISFSQGLFNMTSDSHLFLTTKEVYEQSLCQKYDELLESGYLPLYESKMTYIYNHRHGDFSNFLHQKKPHKLPEVRSADLKNSNFKPHPYFWVRSNDVKSSIRDQWNRDWFLVFRDVTDSRASLRTTIASIIPRYAVGNNLSICYFSKQIDVKLIGCFLACINSLIFDYFARQKVGGLHLNFFIFEQLPVLPPEKYSIDAVNFIIPRVLELTYTAQDLKHFAVDLGFSFEPFEFNLSRRHQLKCELDAYFAKLYGLDRDELCYILDPSKVMGADYPSETFLGLKNKEFKDFGEYRTERLVLEAWDKLEAGTLETAPMQLGVISSGVVDVVVDFQNLPDNDWQRPETDLQAETVLQLAAILRACVTGISIHNARLALLVAMEPRILVPFLNLELRAEWLRLNGSDAAPLADGVTRLQPNTQRNWGEAIRQLRGDGLLIENLQERTWSPGEGLNAFPSQAWAEGRARFVMAWLNSGVTVADVASELPPELRGWLNENVA